MHTGAAWSCQISPILGPQVSHPQPGRSGSPASQSSARRERNGKAIAALGACGACRRPLQRADPRPPRLGDVAPLHRCVVERPVRWWKSTKGRKVKMKMKAGKKNFPFLLDFAIFGPFHFRHFLCFQTARTQQGHVPGHLGDTELSRKENLGRGHGYPNLECLWNMAAAAWLEYMKKRYLIKSFNDQIAGCQLQTLSLFCGTLGESSKHNLTLCCQKKTGSATPLHKETEIYRCEVCNMIQNFRDTDFRTVWVAGASPMLFNQNA